MTALALALSLMLFGLSAIHVYWVVGGEWGFAEALPTRIDGVRLLNPRPIDSAIVAIGLFLLSGFYLSAIIGLPLTGWILGVGKWIIPLLFLLRAVGDFRYVGLFKKIRKTPFGQKDTMFFTPLCLFIAACGFIYAIYGE